MTAATGDDAVETLVRAIASANDDVEETASGSMYFDSSDLELVDDPEYSGNGQTIGLRFTHIDLPIGAVVVRAFLRFHSKSDAGAPVVLKISAFDNPDAAAFATSSHDVSGRPRLATTVEWMPDPWTGGGGTYDTPDLAPLVGEIVARPDWRPGNAIGFVITGSGQRTAYAYDGRADEAPELHVEFRSAGPAPAPVIADTSFDCNAADTGAVQMCAFPELKLARRLIRDLYQTIRSAAASDAFQSVHDGQDAWIARREACRDDYVCVRATLSDWLSELKATIDRVPGTAGAEELTTGLDCMRQRRGIDSVACNLDDVRAIDHEIAGLMAEIAASSTDHARSALQREQDDWVAATDRNCGSIRCLRNAYEMRIVALRGRLAGAADPGELAVVGAWRGGYGCNDVERDYVLDVRGVEARSLKVRILGFEDPDAIAPPEEDTWTDGWYDPGLRRFAFGRFTGELSADGQSLQVSAVGCSQSVTFAAVAVDDVEARLDAGWVAEENTRSAAEAERRAAIAAKREALEAQLAARDRADTTLFAEAGVDGLMDLEAVGYPAGATAEDSRDLFDAAGYLTALRRSPEGRACGDGVLSEWTTLATTVSGDAVPDRPLPDCNARYSWGLLTRLECTADIPFSWPVSERILNSITARLGTPESSAPSPDVALATEHIWSCPLGSDGSACRLTLIEHVAYGRYDLTYTIDPESALALARGRIASMCGEGQ